MPTKDDKPEVIETYSVPEAGRRYYGIGIHASYAAMRRGEIPVIKVGRLFRVPVRLMEEKMSKPDKVEQQP
jgi:hypothetical protein